MQKLRQWKKMKTHGLNRIPDLELFFFMKFQLNLVLVKVNNILIVLIIIQNKKSQKMSS